MNRQHIANVVSSFFLLCFFAWIFGYVTVIVFGVDVWLIAPLVGFYFLAWFANLLTGEDEEGVGAATAEELED